MAQDLRQSLLSVSPLLHDGVKRVFETPRQQTLHDDAWSSLVLNWLESYCLRSGKGLRPWLVAVGAAAAMQKPLAEVLTDPVLQKIMLITELTHKRLLLADDIADRDELRNDEPAFHVFVEQWMEKQPIYAALSKENRRHFARSYSEVAGIWLQQIITAETNSLAADMPSTSWAQLWKDIDRHTYQCTVAGWYMLFDQNNAPLDERVSRESFLKGLELQTAHYSFIGPLLFGQALAPDNSQLRQITERYGKVVGVLFQLSDDVLGLYGDPKKTGKPVGGDVREGKKTLFMQEAFARADAPDRQQLQALTGKQDLTNKDVEWIRNLMASTGAWEAVMNTVGDYQQAALQAVAEWPHAETRELLIQLVAAVAHRDK